MASFNTLRSDVRSADSSARLNACAKQAFIGVDVSYAVQQSLIEQQSLDGRGAPMKQAGEAFFADGERLGAGAGEIALADLQPAKAAGVDKAQLFSRGQSRDQVGVLGDF